MNIFKQTSAVILVPLMLLTAAAAVNSAPVIKVGIAPSPPFAMKNAPGEWEGISVDLWKAVAAKLGLTCEYQECDYSNIARMIANGTLDAGVGQISSLELNDPGTDFTHAFYFSGFALAAPKMTERQHWTAVLRMLRENNFILLVFLILLTLALSGVSIWLLEHRRNPEHFSKNPFHGIGSGLWWSATTITTVGYGDKAPVTFFGRLLAFFWMLTGITLVSVFTATITSMCTVSRLSNLYERPEDLQYKRIGAVAGSQAEVFLQKSGFDYLKASTTPGALKLLSEGRVNIVIDDQSVLKYYCQQGKMTGITILPHLLTLKGYSFGLAKNSPLRDQINQAIGEYVLLPDWQNILFRYLGR